MPSISQPSSQIGESPWTTLQLTRFSHATNENLNPAHVNWIHIPQRDDLVLALDFSQVKSSDGQWQDSKILKVLRGAELMEKLDLNSLVRVAGVEEARIRELKLPISESRVSTLIRSPCIAIRYVTAESKVRRFQLRFPSHQVFESAVSILKNIGLPLHQALPSNASSLGTASIRPDSSSQSRPTSTAQEQLISSQETLSVAKSPELPPKRVENQDAHGVTSLSSLLPSPAFIHDSSTSERRPTFDFSMPPPDNRLRSAGMIPSTKQWSTVNARGLSLPDPETLPRPATTPASVRLIPDSLSQVLPPRRILPFDLPANGAKSKTVSDDLEGTQLQDTQSVSEPPAPKKAATRSGKQPPKPKPKPKAKPVKAPKAPKAKKGKKPEDIAPTPLEMTGSGVFDSQAETNEMVDDAPAALPPRQPVAAAAPVLSVIGPSAVNLAGRKRPSTEMESGQDNEQEPRSAVCLACQHPLTQPASEGAQSNGKMPVPRVDPTLHAAPRTTGSDDVSSEHPNPIEAAISKSATGPPPEANNSLAAYAAQSDVDRLAAVDTFLCRNLMDDDFLKLCEDVERSWRRIGLGPSHAAGGSRLSQRISQISRSADAALFENLCCD